MARGRPGSDTSGIRKRQSKGITHRTPTELAQRRPTKSKPKPSPKPKLHPPIGPYRGAHPGGTRVRDLPKKQRKKAQRGIRKARARGAYEGTLHPSAPARTKREKKLQRKGKAVRKSIAGKGSRQLIGKTPYRKLIQRTGQTRIIREAQVAADAKKIRQLKQKIKDPSTPPKAKLKYQSKLNVYKGDKQRLVARRHLGNVYHAEQTIKSAHSFLDQVDKQKRRVRHRSRRLLKQKGVSKQERRQIRQQKNAQLHKLSQAAQEVKKGARGIHKYAATNERQAKEQFKQSRKANEKAAKLAAVAADIPKVTRSFKPRVVTNKATVQRQRRKLGLQDPFAVTQGALTRKPRVKKHRVPRQFKTKGRHGVNTFFGGEEAMGVAPGKYTRGQLRAIGKQTKESREQPSPAQVALMAAEIGTLPLAPELLALKLAARGSRAIRATRAISGAEKALQATRLTKTGRSLRGLSPATKAERKALLQEAKRQKYRGKISGRTPFMQTRGPLPKLTKTQRRTTLGFTKGHTYKTPARLKPRGPGPIARRKAAAEVAVKARRDAELSQHEARVVSSSSKGNRGAAKEVSKRANTVRGVSNGERAVIKEVETSEASINASKAARDKRVIAGGGEADSIHRQMWDDILLEYRVRAKPLKSGLKLRLRKGVIVGGGIFAAPMVAAGITQNDDLVLNSWRDTHDLIVGAIPSTAALLTASGDAVWHGVTGGAHGSTARINQLWEGIKETDPIALAIQGRWDEAYASFEERPISGLLELTGVYAIAGRGVGRVGRGLPEGIRFGGTGGRESFGLEGTIANQLEYSENFFTKVLQIRGEKLQKKYLSPELEKRMITLQREMDLADVSQWTDKTQLVPTEAVQSLTQSTRKSRHEGAGEETRAQSLNINAGITKPVVVKQRKDGTLVVHDGRERLRLAGEQNFESVPVKVIGYNKIEKAPEEVGLDISTNMFPLESKTQWHGVKGMFGGGMRDVYARHIANRRRVELEKAMDEAFSIAFIGQRSRRATVEKSLGELAGEATSRRKGGYKDGHQSLWFMSTGIARNRHTAIGDVEDHLAELRANRDRYAAGSTYGEVGPEAMAHLDQNIDATKQVLDNPQMLEDPRMWELSKRFDNDEVSRQIELVETGNLLQEQMAYAPWIPFAVRHMKAKFDKRDKTHSPDGSYTWKKTVSADRTKERKVFAGAAYRYEKGEVAEEPTTFKRKNLEAVGDEGDFVIAIDNKTGKVYRIADSEWESSQHIKGAFKAKGEREVTKTLELEDIEAFAADTSRHGGLPVERPTMITTRHFDGGEESEFRSLGIPDPFNQQSTGDAIRLGFADNTFQALQKQAILSRSTIDKTRMYTGLLDRAAMRKKGSSRPIGIRAGNGRSAKQNADNFIKKHFGGQIAEDYVAVNMHEFRKGLDLESAFLTKVGGRLGGQKAYQEMDQMLEAALKFDKRGEPEAEYWVVPKAMIERLKDHAKTEHQTSSAIRAMNREFKGSVLAFSLKWHLGNIADMTTRLFFEGAGPTSYVMGRRILKEMENGPKAQREAWYDIMTLIGGGHLAHADNSLQDFIHISPAQREAVRSLQMRTLGTSMRLGTKGYNAIFDTVGRGYRGFQRQSFGIGQFVERHFRYAAFGKAMKSELRRKNWSYMDRNFVAAVKLQPKVIEETIQGLMDTEIQRKYATHVNRVMGDYTTMSPQFRWAMLHFSPFALWARASTKWVLGLPANSPVRTAMLASVNRWTEPERRAMGLSALKNEGHLPFYMMGAISLGGEGEELIRTNSYTSFGPFTEGNPASFVFPQISNVLSNFNGLDWTGEKLVNANGDEVSQSQRFGIALQSLLETYVQPIAMARSIIAKGDPDPTFSLLSYNHVMDPGSIMSDLEKRKTTMEQFRDPNEPLREVPVEAEALTQKNAAMKALLPFYPAENFLVTQKQRDLREAREAKQGGDWLERDTDVSPSATNWLGEPISPRRKKKPKGYNPPNQAGGATPGGATNWLGQPMK